MSDLQKALDEYLELRRALGFKLADPERHLRKFFTFLECEGAEWITTDLARRWATLSPNVQPAEWAVRLRAVRLFAMYRRATDSRTEVPPQGLLPHRSRRTTPYIYSSNEIVAVLEAARRLVSPSGLRGSTMSTLFGLLAVTGLRIGEARTLDNSDVDLDGGILHVRQGKFGKTRLIPLHPSTSAALNCYICRRDRLQSPKSEAFFVNDEGKRVSYDSIRRAFVNVSRQVGLRGRADTHGPRLHDFRHTFSVRTLIGWYREGRDLERELPKLATYLGHVHWADTYWYITSVPELMGLACDRLEQAIGGLS